MSCIKNLLLQVFNKTFTYFSYLSNGKGHGLRPGRRMPNIYQRNSSRPQKNLSKMCINQIYFAFCTLTNDPFRSVRFYLVSIIRLDFSNFVKINSKDSQRHSITSSHFNHKESVKSFNIEFAQQTKKPVKWISKCNVFIA